MYTQNKHSKNQIAIKKTSQSRIYNRRLVFDSLRIHEALSKAELARNTNLTPQTIANIIDDLKADDYVLETGRRTTPRGQPPVVIEINPQGGYSVGVRIDHKRYDIVISNLLGKCLFNIDGKTPNKDAEGLVEFIADEINAAIIKSKLPKKRFLGVGLVTPGPFDTLWPQEQSPGSLPGFQSHAVTEILSEKTRLPVLLENDAAAAAVGELLFGADRNVRNFFYLFIAEGVGAGLVWNGQLYRGAKGNAGEFGHHIVDPNGKPCYCGNKGCLGQYLSLASLYDHLRQHGNSPDGPDELEALLAENNPALMAWIDTATTALRPAIASLENLLEPEVIILGGTAPAALLEAINARLKPLFPSINAGKKRARIIIGENTCQSIAQGAAAIPIIAATSPNPTIFTSGESIAFERNF